MPSRRQPCPLRPQKLPLGAVLAPHLVLVAALSFPSSLRLLLLLADGPPLPRPRPISSPGGRWRWQRRTPSEWEHSDNLTETRSIDGPSARRKDHVEVLTVNGDALGWPESTKNGGRWPAREFAGGGVPARIGQRWHVAEQLLNVVDPVEALACSEGAQVRWIDHGRRRLALCPAVRQPALTCVAKLGPDLLRQSSAPLLLLTALRPSSAAEQGRAARQA
jgi:hypothetical protein